jgi:tetratricopeptide (TPR) repeat protein
MADQPEEQQSESENSTTNVSGGVNASAEQIDVGGDVVGRDKTISAGTYIEHYYAGSEAAPGKPKVYHNLPQPDYGQFVGREQELKKVHELLSPISRHFVITIDGIGGIGKSALALEVAHRYLLDFERLTPEARFEAIIWTSAKQTALTADGIVQRQQALRTLDDIYSAIAITLQREGITRVRPEEQAEMVRSALTRQRTLLIVDNLETVDDKSVMEFLRELPAPTKAIVTTRHRIDVAYPVRLTGMPWEDAQNLIEQECAKKTVALSDDNQRRLFEHTGGVPLAMTWSVGQMSFGHSVETVLTRLGQPNNDVARFCFEGAVKRISGQPAHHLLMAMSLFTTDASRAALGYVTDLPELDRDEGLVTLEILSLINKGGNRFNMLPLTRGYSYSELARNPVLKDVFQVRWAEYLLDFAAKYKGQEWQSGDISREIPNIMNAIDWSWQNQHFEQMFKPILAIGPQLGSTGDWKSEVRYYEMALQAAAQLDDELMRAYFSRRMASIKSSQDDAQAALELNNNAIEIYRRHEGDDNKKGLAWSLFQVSSIERKMGEFDSARRDAFEGLMVARSIVDSDVLVAAMHCRIAAIELDEGKFNAAKMRLETAGQIIEAIPSLEKDSWLLPYLSRLTGIAALRQGDYATATINLDAALAKARANSNFVEIAQANRQIALLEELLNHPEQAYNAASESLEIFERLGMKRQAGKVREILSRLGARKK